MTHIIVRIALLAAILPAALTSGAQTLNKEITVERTVVPERRDASRLAFTPVVSLPQLPASTLSYSLQPVTARVTPSVVLLDPAAWGDSIYESPWRGYVGAGFMPRFNGAFTAGFRPVSTRSTILDVYAGYTGHVYGYPKVLGGPNPKYIRRHDATVGAAVSHTPDAGSRLTASVDYTFTRFTNNASESAPNAMQNLNRGGISAAWTSRRGDFDYGVSAGVRLFSFVKGELDHQLISLIEKDPSLVYYSGLVMDPNRETTMDAGATVGLDLGEGSELRLDADFGLVHGSANYAGSDWRMRLRPQYSLRRSDVILRLGANVDFAHGCGKAFMVAPEVRLGYTPDAPFAAEVSATGGVILNPMESIFAWDPFMPATQSFDGSRMPLRVDAKLTFGPQYGLWGQIFGAYAAVNDWYIPSPDPVTQTLERADFRSWQAGVAAGYSFGRLASIKASAAFTPKSAKHGWYEWHDRARCVVGASLAVTPGHGLSFGVDYELRTDRRWFPRYYSNLPGEAYILDLESVSNLGARASMAVTPRLTVFLHGTNLLNHKYTLVGDMPAQGISGLAGVTYKF